MKREGAYFVYMVRCADGSLYTGVAKDVLRRVQQHNAGVGAKYTRGRGPVLLVWMQHEPSFSEALKREAWLKTMPRQFREGLVDQYAVRTLELELMQKVLRG